MNLKKRVLDMGILLSEKWKARKQVQEEKSWGKNRVVAEKGNFNGGKNNWRTSRVLRLLFAGLFCVSTILGTFTGVDLIRTAGEMDQYKNVSASQEVPFAESVEFHNILAEYMDLFELYMELTEIVSPAERENFDDVVLLQGVEDGEAKGKTISLQQLYDNSESDYDYRAYASNYLNDMVQYYDNRDVSLLKLTEQIRSLETMVVVEDGKVFYTPKAFKTFRDEERRKIERKAAKLTDQQIYQGNEIVLPDIVSGESVSKAKKITLLSGKCKVVPQNLYQNCLFQQYPEYANAYMQVMFAKAFQEGFKEKEDGIDYGAYRSGFMRDYRKTCSWKADDFFVEEVDDNTLQPKKQLCSFDKKTGELKNYPDSFIFYLEETGEQITAAELKENLDWFDVRIYDTSKKEYAQRLEAHGKKEMKELADNKKPWDGEIAPCSMTMAQNYAKFLIDFYLVLREMFQRSRFTYYCQADSEFLNGTASWKSMLNKIKSGQIDTPEDAVDNVEFFYGYYDSNGSVFRTNFPESSYGQMGMKQYLKQVGAGYGEDKNYICAVGMDMFRITRQNYNGSDIISQIYQQFQAGQEELQILKGQFVDMVKILVGAGFGMVLFFLLLLMMCGYRKDQDTICLWWSDRVWLEAILLIIVGGGCLFFWLMGGVYREGGYWFDWWEQFGVPSVMATLLLVMAFFVLSLTRRWKAGQIFSSSFIYQCIHWGKKLSVRGRRGWKRLEAYFDELPALKRYVVWLAAHVPVIIFVLGLCCLVMDFSIIDTEVFIIALVLVVTMFAVDLYCVIRCLRNALADERIRQGALRIAQGELSYKIGEMTGISKEQAELIDVINHIGEGLEQAVEESVRSERMKTELITNVSHDIKTPLTSVINYIDLLKREQIDSDKVREYLEVLDAKSQRLKVLIEDLVEASKASSGALELQITKLNFNELLRQTNGEFAERFEQAGLTLVAEIPQETVSFRGDGRRVYRVLENLYGNVAKYAMRGTRVYVQLLQTKEKAVLTIKNISREQMNITAEELTERFVRGEQSRSTEGSGLGLSIAKNLTELMEGEFKIYLDGDLFRVTVSFPVSSTGE